MSNRRNIQSLIFLILATLLAVVRGPHTACLNNGNYTDENGFYNASLGESPNRVHAFALCRGDIPLTDCRSCVGNATADILQLCPNNRQAIRWRAVCTLQYSDETLFRVIGVPNAWLWWRRRNATNTNQFMSDLVTLINSLRVQASNGGSLRKVAAGNITPAGFQVIFALEQCNPDLSAQDCETCLLAAAQLFPTFSDGLIGASVYRSSCNIYHDNYQFYNQTRLQELAFVPSAPPTSTVVPPALSQPVAGNDGNRTRTIIIAVVSVAVGLILTAVVGFLLWKRNHKPKGGTKTGAGVDDDIDFAESWQYDFGLIKAATDGFSVANTLGQGGFGLVYKEKLPNGKKVAVSSGSSHGDLEFKNEVMLLDKLQHRNLVRLFGFSIEGPESFLCMNSWKMQA